MCVSKKWKIYVNFHEFSVYLKGKWIFFLLAWCATKSFRVPSSVIFKWLLLRLLLKKTGKATVESGRFEKSFPYWCFTEKKCVNFFGFYIKIRRKEVFVPINVCVCALIFFIVLSIRVHLFAWWNFSCLSPKFVFLISINDIYVCLCVYVILMKFSLFTIAVLPPEEWPIITYKAWMTT